MTWLQQFWAIAMGVAAGVTVGRLWADFVYAFGILALRRHGWWP